MEDIGNILEHDDELNEDQLNKYLAGNADADELHGIEKKMASSEFVNDAVEGLQSFSSKTKVDDYVVQLNKSLQKHLENKKHRKEKRKIKDLLWVIVAVIMILLLCLIAFVIIKMQREKQVEKHSVITDINKKNNDDPFTFML
jgi:uncharacterized membrane protein YvbJ